MSLPFFKLFRQVLMECNSPNLYKVFEQCFNLQDSRNIHFSYLKGNFIAWFLKTNSVSNPNECLVKKFDERNESYEVDGDVSDEGNRLRGALRRGFNDVSLLSKKFSYLRKNDANQLFAYGHSIGIMPS